MAVMYQQGENAVNEGLIEIKDKNFIDGLKKSINLSGAKVLGQLETTPYVIGSLVRPSYQRKLKMIRSELFALLAIS